MRSAEEASEFIRTISRRRCLRHLDLRKSRRTASSASLWTRSNTAFASRRTCLWPGPSRHAYGETGQHPRCNRLPEGKRRLLSDDRSADSGRREAAGRAGTGSCSRGRVSLIRQKEFVFVQMESAGKERETIKDKKNGLRPSGSSCRAVFFARLQLKKFFRI